MKKRIKKYTLKFFSWLCMKIADIFIELSIWFYKKSEEK